MVASFETSTVPTILPLIIKQVRFHDATSKQRKASDHNFSSSKLGRFYWVKFVFSLPKMTYHARLRSVHYHRRQKLLLNLSDIRAKFAIHSLETSAALNLLPEAADLLFEGIIIGFE